MLTDLKLGDPVRAALGELLACLAPACRPNEDRGGEVVAIRLQPVLGSSDAKMIASIALPTRPTDPTTWFIA